MFPAAAPQTDEEYDYRAEIAESELLWRRADIIPAGQWSLYQRLMDVHAVLAAWDQPAHVQLAGLLHAAYDVQPGGLTLFDVSERDTVRALIGDEAEAIVFCAFETPTNGLCGEAGDAAADRTLRAHAATVQLARLTQSCAENGAPIAWLATAAKLASAARGADTPPPPFARGTATVGADDDDALMTAYERLSSSHVLIDADPPSAHDVAVTERVPWVAEPFIRRGVLALAMGDVASAAALGERARVLLTEWNVAWDKRLSPVQWLSLADFLRSTASLGAADAEFLSTRVTKILQHTRGPEGVYLQLESCGALGSPRLSVDVRDDVALDDVHAGDVFAEFQLMPARFSRYIAGLRDPDAPERMAMYPEIAARPWWDPEDVRAVEFLERAASDIVAEFAALDRAAFTAVDSEGCLSVARLIDGGRLVEPAASACPRTLSALASCGETQRNGPSAFFALLPARAETVYHRSRTNVLVQCCLGLSPEGTLGVEVDRIRERLRFRRCLVFDESYTHRRWNAHGDECAMLVVRLWHPDLTAAEIDLLDGWNRTIAYEASRRNRVQLRSTEVSDD